MERDGLAPASSISRLVTRHLLQKIRSKSYTDRHVEFTSVTQPFYFRLLHLGDMKNETLSDGTRVLLRPVLPEDKARLLDGFERLSEQKRYRRFMSHIRRLSEEQVVYFTEIDYRDHFAWAAFLDEPTYPAIGVARYVRTTDDPEAAELAVVVVDEHQRRGVGRLLLELLSSSARDNEIKYFRGQLADNHPAIDGLKKLGARTAFEAGITRFEIDLTPPEQ